MTADRPAPDTDALARLIESGHYTFNSDDQRHRMAQDDAARILAAIESDPDVQAAILAALTRGGAICEEWCATDRTSVELGQWPSEGAPTRAEADALWVNDGDDVTVRRLVTPWREVDQ